MACRVHPCSGTCTRAASKSAWRGSFVSVLDVLVVAVVAIFSLESFVVLDDGDDGVADALGAADDVEKDAACLLLLVVVDILDNAILRVANVGRIRPWQVRVATALVK